MAADALIRTLSSPGTAALPRRLADELDAFLATLDAPFDDVAAVLQETGSEAVAARVLAVSEFVRRALCGDPAGFAALIRDGEMTRARHPGEIAAAVARAVEDVSPQELARRLRRLRRREMARIAWRDLGGLATLDETLHELSDLADEAVIAAIRHAGAAMSERHGVVRDAAGRPVSLIAMAMGKLGGRELNFSSDIDLIFVYPDAEESDGAKALSAPEYFGRMVRRVVALLGEVTADGFVFRVDIRLRPFGDSGPPVVSFSAMENYLLQHGRDWERYAYVKARPLSDEAGMAAWGELEETVLTPFVYRRYLDYGVFESLRSMKAMIRAEVERREMHANVKLGPGGIREIEFITQSWQLVRGGSDQALRCRELRAALTALAERRYLPAESVWQLLDAYRFLRRLENRLQEFRDRQTHDLPGDETDRTRLALVMDQPDWDSLAAEVERVRGVVGGHFEETVFRAGEDVRSERPALEALWESAGSDSLEERAAAAGFAAAEAFARVLGRLHADIETRRLDEISRQRLDELMPPLLERLRGLEEPDVALHRLTGILGAVLRRSAYLALLLENRQALERLVELVSKSAYLATELAAHPLLMDELIDPRIADREPSAADLRVEYETRLSAVGAEDSEAAVDELARFQRAATFRVAVADFSGRLPIMKVSDRLTEIAEMVVASALSLAWKDLVARHGRPWCTVDGMRRRAGFAVVGYGKLGGIELGYGSDLDLVFVHDSAGEEQETDGAKCVDNTVFFGRLARRLVHFLTVQTVSGALYEVDTRLRPSGRSGLLVSSVAALERYQREDAWTWEHQALLRTRAVAGDARVRHAFEGLRVEILQSAVRRETLRDDVISMRERMWRQLSSSESDSFDIKRDPGGVGDIEFIVQYLVLAHAHRHRSLLHYTDNIRQLGVLATCGILEHTAALALQDIYRAYRRRLHHLALDNQDATVPAGEFAAEAGTVRRIWRQTFG